jgi:hypothetical protein
MGYSIANESSTAVIGSISMESSSFGVFNAPDSGSFPLSNGEQADGTFTELSDGGGSPYATLQVFFIKGDAKAETYVGGELYSTTKHGSGISTIQVPEILDTETTIYIEFSDI